MEYITRQRIYDSRYWKEECFGLSVADVLEKAAGLQCIGNLPTRFLSLVLKLLQLQPESDLIFETFIEQDEFKYVRALGAMYLRMTGRPLDIYQSLEPLYNDYRQLRVWNHLSQEWSILHMDEWTHQLLRENHVLGVTLPRLPIRRTLQEAGYLPDGPRSTALHDVLIEYGGPLEYFRHKVNLEGSEAAKQAWEARNQRLGVLEPEKVKLDDMDSDERPKKKKKEKETKYGSLFKTKDDFVSSTNSLAVEETAAKDDAYWNDERARLGLNPLRK
jgi:pre-mRNA-splicing factor 38A